MTQCQKSHLMWVLLASLLNKVTHNMDTYTGAFLQAAQ